MVGPHEPNTSYRFEHLYVLRYMSERRYGPSSPQRIWHLQLAYYKIPHCEIRKHDLIRVVGGVAGS